MSPPPCQTSASALVGFVASSSSQSFMPRSSRAASPRKPAKKSARTISSKRGGAGVLCAREAAANTSIFNTSIPNTSVAAKRVTPRLGLVMVAPPRRQGSTVREALVRAIGRTAGIADERPVWENELRPARSAKPGDHVLAEAAHRVQDRSMRQVSIADLAQDVPDAGVAQFGHLLADALGRAVERGGLERVAYAVLV